MLECVMVAAEPEEEITTAQSHRMIAGTRRANSARLGFGSVTNEEMRSSSLCSST